jgi:prevent-host-death family protein
MKTASVTELKAHLSKYLRMVRRGSEVQVLERGVPIARLVGLQGASAEKDRDRLERLERAGILRRGTSDLSWLTKEPLVEMSGETLSDALAEDREDRF